MKRMKAIKVGKIGSIVVTKIGRRYHLGHLSSCFSVALTRGQIEKLWKMVK